MNINLKDHTNETSTRKLLVNKAALFSVFPNMYVFKPEFFGK